MSVQILIGDVRDRLAGLASDSVDCVVTSPPYWGLRDYGVVGQLGMEATYQEHIAGMVAVFEEVRRVLKPTGTCWMNYGDSYATAPNGRAAADVVGDDRTFRDKPFSTIQGNLKSKDLCGIPWRVAFALQDAGWYLRQDIIWAKPNPMPESVTDRCTKSHEYIFLLTKRPKYYFDAEAIAEPLASSSIVRLAQDIEAQEGSDRVPGKTNGKMKAVYTKPYTGTSTKDYAAGGAQDASATKARIVEKILSGELTTRNKRSVWFIPTQSFSEAHFATFPPDLIEPCILAGCPEGGLVLDPFGGAGTTGLVADRLRRNAILIELNPEYAEIAQRRLNKDGGMFAQVSVL